MKRLLAFALIFWAVPAFAQVPSSKVLTWNDYRLSVEFNNILADSMIRFPKKSTGSNNLIDQQAANQVNRQAVQWVHVTLLTGAADVQFVLYSTEFPAGSDTTRVTSAVRTFTFGGCDVDSVKYINPAVNVNWHLYATDGH